MKLFVKLNSYLDFIITNNTDETTLDPAKREPHNPCKPKKLYEIILKIKSKPFPIKASYKK